jgi:hypothetical protein
MHRYCSAIAGITFFFLLSPSWVVAEAANLPSGNNEKVIATVGDTSITLDDLNSALASFHATMTVEKKAGPIDYSDILGRIINTRLILLESRNMGLQETPEVLAIVKKFSQETLMEMLLEAQVKDIKAQQVDIDRIYQGLVKEWKIHSIMVKKDEDAKKIAAKIKAGNDFEDVIKNAISNGTAEDGKEKFLRDKDLTPSVAQLVSQMEIGSVSPVVPVDNKGFIIFKLEGSRIQEKEDAEAMQTARQEALDQVRVATTKKYYQVLKDRYSELQKDIFASIDYESKDPGFEKLRSDNRVVAKIKGESPITVGDLTKAMDEKFYHGVDIAIEEKKVNKSKEEVLESMLEKRILVKEALKQGLDKTEEYKKRVNAYEDSVIFGLFINKVVNPDIKMTQDELKKYYAHNLKKYTPSQMFGMKNLVFQKKKDAESSLDKLRKGTDFTWLSSHAEGLVDKGTEGVLNFDENLISLNTLPEEMKKLLSGAKFGDFKLYSDSKGYFYVLYIYQVVNPDPQTFEEVKEEIAKTIYQDKQKKAIEDWAEKLKAYYPVKIYQSDLIKSH